MAKEDKTGKFEFKTKDMVRERVIHKVLERQVAEYGNREFLYFKDEKFGYRDLDQYSNKIACGFQKLGISKGNKVAIMLNNCPEFIFLLFGLSKLGAIEVPINTAHKGDLLIYMLDQSDSRVLVMDSEFLERVEPVLHALPKLETLVILGSEKMPNLPKSTISWSQIIDNNGAYEAVEVLWSDPYCILYTSGTTGPSKGVMSPQNFAIRMGEICWEAAEYNIDDCLYTALPLFHGNAQQLSLIPALMSGARMALAERFSAGKFWDDIRRYGCTEANTVGGIIPILYKADPKPNDADNPLRVMLTAAAPKDIWESFEKRFEVTLVEIYGMTEIGLPLMSNIRERKAGSCGKPRYCDVRVVDENRRDVGPHTVGELLVRPRKDYAMLLEYYNMPDKTVEAWRDLWFYTGDYFYYDEDGYFYFVDRKKDALRRRGENISSYEVEKVVNSHPSVLESTAVAVKSPLGEDEVMICLVLKQGHTLLPEELIAYCEDRMAYFMVPRYVRFMDAFPKTPTERVQKHKLREEGITSDTWDREAAGYKLKR